EPLRDAVERLAVLQDRDQGAVRLAQEFGAEDEARVWRKAQQIALVVDRARLRAGARPAIVEGRVAAVQRAEEAVLDAARVDIGADDLTVVVDVEDIGRGGAGEGRDRDQGG